MLPYLIEIGSFRIPTYGVLVAIAFLSALYVTTRLARHWGVNEEKVLNLGMYCAIAGIVGAKLAMFIADADYFFSDWSRIFSLNTLQAAGIFYGGLILALIVAVWYLRSNGMPVLGSADLFAPGIALGHGIGRLGCFAAGCCWGNQCGRSVGVIFTSHAAHDLTGVPIDVPLYPTQLYEAGAEFVLFAWLYRACKREHTQGAIIGQYVVIYSIIRFLVDYLRRQDQPNPFGGPFTTAQLISLVLIATVAVVWLLSRRTPAVEMKKA